MTDDELFLLLKQKFGAAKKANNHWVRVRCPTCLPKDANKMKRGVHLRTLSTNCFICKEPLSLPQLFGKAAIAPSCGGVTSAPKEHPQAREWPCNAVIPVSALAENHPAVQFLNNDHLTDRLKLWTEYKVGYITAEDAKDIIFDKYDGKQSAISTANSLVFPVFYNKELVGWQCRFIPGTPNGNKMGKMKYLHVFHKGSYLYNYDNAKNYDILIVVEGIKKSWKFDNAVATLGKNLTDTQVQLIQQWDKIIFMMDGEQSTQKTFHQLTEAIKLNGKQCVNIDPRDYGFDSPDSMTTEQAQTIAYQGWKKKYE